MCKNFRWRLKGIEFCSNIFLIPLGSCDVALGVQWLSTLGTIKWNFKELRMKFYFGFILVEGSCTKRFEGSKGQNHSRQGIT